MAKKTLDIKNPVNAFISGSFNEVKEVEKVESKPKKKKYYKINYSVNLQFAPEYEADIRNLASKNGLGVATYIKSLVLREIEKDKN